MESLILSIVVLGTLGFVFAGLLALAADYFRVEEDPRVAAVLAILPGSNCGACGSASCRNFAERLLKGEVRVGGCLAGGGEVEAKLAGVMGVDAQGTQKRTAAVHCGAKEDQRTKAAHYSGVKSCAGADIVGGGLACRYGCLGYGDCFCACPFDAIKMKEGMPVVEAEKCTACGKCVPACPRQIISLRPYDFKVEVACASRDKGSVVRKICPVGCIACKICERQVPEIFKVVDNLAVMDYSKTGINCDTAIEKCPARCIVRES